VKPNIDAELSPHAAPRPAGRTARCRATSHFDRVKAFRVLGLLVAAVLFPVAPWVSAADRPNFIVINIDDGFAPR